MLMKEPLQVRNLTLLNRLVMPPMATGKTPDGFVTEELKEYYRERAEGGSLGLIIMEHCYVAPEGRASAKQVSVSRDEDAAGLKELADTIHAAGSARFFVQINHAGVRAKREVTGFEPVGPSPVSDRGEQVHALTADEIRALEEKYAEAAVRVKEAGADGVEVHCAHGYLLNQFWSPITNHREDAYGASSVEDRIRFAAETVAKVRAAVGEEFPVAIRLGGSDYREGGSTIEEAAEAAKILEAAGADLIDISGGLCGYTLADRTEPGWFADLSGAVKKAVHVPVLLTGGVHTARQAEALVQAGAADLIGIGRDLYLRADWAKLCWEAEQ